MCLIGVSLRRMFALGPLIAALALAGCGESGPPNAEIWDNMQEQWPAFTAVWSAVPDIGPVDPVVHSECFSAIGSGAPGVSVWGGRTIQMRYTDAQTAIRSIRSEWEQLGHDIIRYGPDSIGLLLEGAAELSIRAEAHDRPVGTQSSILDEKLVISVGIGHCAVGHSPHLLLLKPSTPIDE